ncbi:uncharacterized protein LOC142237916 [Haematobia irritans]|uniref:uncharacterized protein LOC142237916 n=1 Tax=Haematobia irritans TaxID=7368 RepID=UPI003F5053AA
MELSHENTFIFNWVDNYDRETKKLKTTLEDPLLNNRVCIFNHLTSDELHKQMCHLTQLSFNLFRYVVVIVLENKTKNERFICTKDGVHILLDSELLTLFKTNKSLLGKTRLFIIQKLQDFNDTEDENGAVEERRKFVYSTEKFQNLQDIYEGLQYSVIAYEETTNFHQSPFIDIFCEKFLENSLHLPMSDIYRLILHKIKRDYGIDIVFNHNKRSHETGVLGIALEPDEARVFL